MSALRLTVRRGHSLSPCAIAALVALRFGSCSAFKECGAMPHSGRVTGAKDLTKMFPGKHCGKVAAKILQSRGLRFQPRFVRSVYFFCAKKIGGPRRLDKQIFGSKLAPVYDSLISRLAFGTAGLPPDKRRMQP